MKIKTADLIGPTLDWAVAVVEGLTEENAWTTIEIFKAARAGGLYWYSTDWSQGGPLVEREKLELRCNDDGWQAFCFGFPVAKAHSGRRVWASGPTPLIAAMRTLVAGKFGDEVDVPDELMK